LTHTAIQFSQPGRISIEARSHWLDSHSPEPRAVFITNRAKLSHTLIIFRFELRTALHPAGVEPAHPPWRDGTLPLRHRCILSSPNCQRSNRRAPGGTRTHVLSQFTTAVGLHPRYRPAASLAGAVSWPLNDQCKRISLSAFQLNFQWDQTDLNRHNSGKNRVCCR
jgi:hypothetical protein